jgi:hypothetical protein
MAFDYLLEIQPYAKGLPEVPDAPHINNVLRRQCSPFDLHVSDGKNRRPTTAAVAADGNNVLHTARSKKETASSQ